MKRILLIIGLFLLTVTSLTADKYFDSLQKKYHSAKADTTRYELLQKIIDEYLETAHGNYNPDTAVILLDRILPEIRMTHDLHRYEAFLHLKGLACIRKKNFEEAIIYCDSCIKMAETFSDNDELGNLYLLQEMVYRIINLDARRVQVLYKAIECFRRAGSLEGAAGAYFTLGNVYAANLQDDLAVKSYLQGAAIRNSLHDSIGAGINYLFCAAIVMKKGDLKLAGEYIEKGRPVLRSKVVFQPLYYYIIYGRWLKSTGRKEEAIKNLEMAASIAVRVNQRYQKPTALCEMAEILLDKKDYAKARQKLEEAKTIADREKFLTIKITVRKLLSKYYEAVGNPVKALEEYKVMQVMKDSLNQNELSRALTSSSMEAEFNRKEADRTKLQLAKDEENAQKLRRQRLIAYSTVAVLLFVGVVAFLLYRSFRQKKVANRIIAAEKQRSDNLLRNILPDEVAEELKETGSSKAREFPLVTVLFTDFKNFTAVSERLTAQQLVNEIHYYYTEFDNIVSRFGIEKIKTIGDSYMCAGGLPVEDPDNPINAVKAALEMRDFVLREKKNRTDSGLPCFDIRIGLHSGPVVAGIVGTKKFAYDIWGDTVNIASRMESSGEPGKVNVSSSTYELIRERSRCVHRGMVAAKNKGMIDMYFVEDVA